MPLPAMFVSARMRHDQDRQPGKATSMNLNAVAVAGAVLVVPVLRGVIIFTSATG